MSRYILKTSLPTHCENIAQYWSTLPSMARYAGGKSLGQRYKAARAFKATLKANGFSDEQCHNAYRDTLELARLKMEAE